MIKELHIAAQYLAAAAISFVEKKDDDSHTNLGWSNESLTLSTRSLNSNGDKLALDFSSYSLVWNTTSGVISSLGLDKVTHNQVLEWINLQLKGREYDSSYKYSLHYDIGYGIDIDNYSFPEANNEELQKIANHLNVAQSAMQDILEKKKLNSEIRVWPHHFDLGAYTVISETLSLGFGLAIPDSGIDDFYYYISGYKGNDTLETKNFQKLENGEWQTGEWKAGTLRACDVNIEKAIGFLSNTIATFRKHYS
jgi:hypothetical protein